MLGKALSLAAAGNAGEETDENFNQTVLLLHGDGTNGAQNNTFLDSSSNNFTITRNGNTTQGTFSPFSAPDGRWSNYFDGTGDYLDVPDNVAFSVGTGDFTAECWFYRSDDNAITLFDTRDADDSSGFAVLVSGSTLYVRAAGIYIITGTTVTNNQWNHVAVCRSSGTTRLFLNGVQSGSDYSDSNDYTADNFTIGRVAYTSLNFWKGYISNVRLLKGTALYTTTFTPPTTPLTNITNTSLLTCQSNRFVDNSTNNFAITSNGDVKVTPFSPFAPTAAYSPSVNGGSGYFDGTGDYLEIAEDVATRPAANDFTFECWVYPTNNATKGTLFSQGTSGVYSPLSVYFNTTQQIQIDLSSTGTSWNIAALVSSNATLNLYEWSHIAVVRDGEDFNLYINGVFDKTIATSSATLMTPTQPTRLGQRTGSPTQYPYTGYIAGWRFVIGTALYSGATYTIPTSPPTAITDTELLCNFTNAGIFDNTGKNNLETVGNAQIDTTTKKYGTGSMEFDGSGDYLLIPYTPDLRFEGNFTIELWVNPTSKVSSYPCMVTNYSTYTTNGGFAIFAGHSSANTSKYNIAFNGSFPVIQSTTSIVYGSWTHLALVRNGSTLTLYVNGVSEGTSTQTATVVGTANNWWIGTAGDAIANGYFNGYIDDLRITKGVARYTANFTPPTAAFPNL